MIIKTLILFISVIFIIITYLWFSKTLSIKEFFTTTSNKLQEIQNSVYEMLDKNIGTRHMHSSKLKHFNTSYIMDCIQKNMKDNNIPVNAFKLDGETFDEPILNIYKTNRQLYDILGKCGLLYFMGYMIFCIQWITNIHNLTPKLPISQAIKVLIISIDMTDWNNIETWENIRTLNYPKLYQYYVQLIK